MSRERGEEKEHGKDKDSSGLMFLFGDCDQGSAQVLIKEIIEHNLKNEHEFLQLIVNCEGGSAAGAWALIDIMTWSKIPIYTTGLGLVSSAGLLVFMAGEKGHRILTPRTSVLSHRFSWGRMGKHSELVAVRKEEDLEYSRMLDHYLRYSGLKTQAELEKHLLRESDTWLSADEAVKFGLADHVEGDGLSRLKTA